MNRKTSKVALLLVGSGASALIYQTVWLREFMLIFGSSTAASAAVLATFLGGLGAGSLLLGARADRARNPLRLYATLELSIAFSAAITPALVRAVREVYLWTGGTAAAGLFWGTIARLLLSAVVLAVPTLLMGGTLPAAARAVETEKDVARRGLALLYGLNALGAVTGALLSTFYLLETLGNRRTLWLACLVNLLVAVAAWRLSRESRSEPAAPAADRSSVPAAGSIPPAGSKSEWAASTGPHAPPAFVLLAAAVAGFAFLLMEMIWYRMLAPLLGGSSFTFGLILAVALAGIGLGGAAYAIFGRNRPASLRAFGLTCGLEALCIALPYALGDRVAVLALLLRPLGALGFSGYVAGWTVVASLVVLPAAFVSGVQFPLLVALLGSGRGEVGRQVGLAYAVNTLGAIAGSLAGGFGLLPALSAPGAWRLVVVTLAVLGLSSQALRLRTTRRGWAPAVPSLVAASVALLLLLATGPTAAWRHNPIGTGRAKEQETTRNGLRNMIQEVRRTIEWEAEGVESSIGVSNSAGYTFLINGKSDGNARGDAGTQILGGLVGAILHPRVTRSLVIGLGTGSTAGWLAVVPSMEKVEVVELEPAILHFARLCGPVNQRVLDNPKVHLTIGDAREVLQTTPERFDLIFSEPSNPYRAGIASLYTEDFYRAVRSRLEEGGIFLQWLQAYEVDGQTIQTAFATLSSVFSSVEVWLTLPSDLLVACSPRPFERDAAFLRERIRQEPFRSALLHVWRVDDLEGLLAHYVARPEFIRSIEAKSGIPRNTDDLNVMEFGFARTVGNSSYFNVSELLSLARQRGEHRPPIHGEVDWNAVEERRFSMGVLFYWQAFDAPASFDPAARMRTRAKMEYARENLSAAAGLWRLQERDPSDPLELELLAEGLAELGDQTAPKWISRLHSLEPIEADVCLARLKLRMGQPAEAVELLERAFRDYRTDPWPDRRMLLRAINLDAAAGDRSLAARLFAALEEPFCVRLLNEARLWKRLELASTVEGKSSGELTQKALEGFEPNVPWQNAFLTLRYRCFSILGDRREEVAGRDLEDFLASGSIPFSAGLLPRAGEPVSGGGVPAETPRSSGLPPPEAASSALEH